MSSRAIFSIRAALLVLLVSFPAAAQEDLDLERIPTPSLTTPAEDVPDVATAKQNKLFSENVIAVGGYRNNLVVPSLPPSRPDAQARSSLDGTFHRDWSDGWSATFSDRFDLSWRNDLDAFNHRSIANDLREAYLTWEPRGETYMEGGRINLRNGGALGFNPTDFFKTRSSISQTSLDPSAIRNNRLGSFMWRGQSLWSGGSLGLAIAPKLADAHALPSIDPGGFGIGSDRTNAENRFLVSLSPDIADFSPQVLVYHEANRTRFGFNASHQIGQSVIAYGEWAGGRQPSAIAEAVAFGKRTGELPAFAPVPASDGSAASFKNDLALGASWTSSEKVTLNAEYHLHQAGWSRRDLHDWFASGAQGSPSWTRELWYLRGYAADQQDPLARQQIFLRADWTDALVSHLELTALAFVSLSDGSSRTQLSATYDLSDRWTMGLFATAALGTTRSEWGSIPQSESLSVQAIRYF